LSVNFDFYPILRQTEAQCRFPGESRSPFGFAAVFPPACRTSHPWLISPRGLTQKNSPEEVDSVNYSFSFWGNGTRVLAGSSAQS